MFQSDKQSQSTQAKLRTVRRVLGGLFDLDLMMDQQFGLVSEDDLPFDGPCIKSSTLILLQKAQKMAQENPMEFCDFFSTVPAVADVFAKTRKLHRLTTLAVFPFHPNCSEEFMLEGLSGRSWEFTSHQQMKTFFSLSYWVQAQQLASSDILSCTAVTGLPLSVANLLAVSHFEQICSFSTTSRQRFRFNLNVQELIDKLGDSSEPAAAFHSDDQREAPPVLWKSFIEIQRNLQPIRFPSDTVKEGN